MTPRPVVGADDRGQPVFLGECRVHGWHGRTVCPQCRESGRVSVQRYTPTVAQPRSYHTISVSASLLQFRGGGREKTRQEGRCRMCLRDRKLRSLTRHHLVPDRFFRYQLPSLRVLRSVDANIVPLCRPDHDLIESPDKAVRMEARRMLRRRLGADEVAFMIQVRGEDWLAANYPAR